MNITFLILTIAMVMGTCYPLDSDNRLARSGVNLIGKSREGAEKWLEAHTYNYGFESAEDLIKRGADADTPELRNAAGRFNGLLKQEKSESHRITNSAYRIYVYMSKENRVSAVKTNLVVTGP